MKSTLAVRLGSTLCLILLCAIVGRAQDSWIWPEKPKNLQVLPNHAAPAGASHCIGFWDTVILASASEDGCRLLLTEDLQEGFTWNGVTVTTHFAKSPHPLLREFLK